MRRPTPPDAAPPDGRLVPPPGAASVTGLYAAGVTVDLASPAGTGTGTMVLCFQVRAPLLPGSLHSDLAGPPLAATGLARVASDAPWAWPATPDTVVRRTGKERSRKVFTAPDPAPCAGSISAAKGSTGMNDTSYSKDAVAYLKSVPRRARGEGRRR